MKIKEMSQLNYLSNISQIKKVKPVGKEKIADKAEISREAKELSRAHSNLTPERAAEINKRIRENYYDREDVLKTVAERIMRSSGFKELLNENNVDGNV